jgi:hypothetical protein
MNADRAKRFHVAPQHFSTNNFNETIFQNRPGLSSVSSATDPSQEIVMASFLASFPASFRKISGISQCTLAAASVVATLLWAGAAFASQGPGGGLGTASNFTQLAMAIIVYGTSALVVGGGLIGAARKH